MAMKTTRWSPDTCGCVFEYEWDDSLPEAARVHTFTRMVQACVAHSSGEEPVRYTAVVEENTRKNIAFALAQQQRADLTPDNYVWSFDTNRDLNIQFVGRALTTTQRTALQAALDAQFPTRRVRT